MTTKWPRAATFCHSEPVEESLYFGFEYKCRDPFATLHDELVAHFQNCGARHVGEVTTIIIGAAVHTGASVVQS